MTKQEKETLAALVRKTFEEMGGSATAEDVAQHVVSQLPADVYRALTWAPFVGSVRGALRSTLDDGLVYAAAINGTYVARTLWDEGEYRFVIRDHMKRSRNERRLAYRYAEECRERTGLWIDPADVAATYLERVS